jgi:apolipoprotein N-acyltransferase
MHFLPFMAPVSYLLMPLFFEALCVSCSTMLYSLFFHKQPKNILLQAMALLLISISLSCVFRFFIKPTALKKGLECTILQEGYSRQDYFLIDLHPVFGKKIAQKYLNYIREISGARFLVLPESAFPILQIENSEFLEAIKNTARLHNEYIMSGILLSEGGNIYNASVLIDPEGRLQNIYRKRNTVLFVESTRFTPGIMASTFTVDGHIIAPVICFESLIIRNYFREEKPELYIVISNDVFAEKTILSKLHQAYGVINARTLGVPLLHVMQNGPSSYVDTKGRLTNLTMPYKKVIGLPVEIR